MQAVANRLRDMTVGTRSLGESSGSSLQTSPSSKVKTQSRMMQVLVTGRIESGQFVDQEELSCSYEFVVGPDWQVRAGMEGGETQHARNRADAPERPSVTWNFPIEMSFNSSNTSGWPRISICVRDRQRNLVGYGTLYVPTTDGSSTRYCRLFRPLASSTVGESIATIVKEIPEFYDSRFTTANVGREAVRTVSSGVVKVTLMTKVMGRAYFGYES